MVQANALLVAIALTVTVSPALAVPAPTCDEIRAQSRHYTMAELKSMAKKAKLAPAQWEALLPCLDPKKK